MTAPNFLDLPQRIVFTKFKLDQIPMKFISLHEILELIIEKKQRLTLRGENGEIKSTLILHSGNF